MRPTTSSGSERPKRLLLVAARYWPYANDDTLRLSQLVRRLGIEGWRTTVITPRWHRSWPERIQVEGAQVVRLNDPPTGALRQSRYRRNLSQWLAAQQSGFAAVWCDDADSDATEATIDTAVGERLPVIVRYEPAPPLLPPSGGEMGWALSSRALRNCQRAATIIAPTVAAHQQLIASGIAADRVARVAEVWAAVIDRTPTARRSARQGLAEINYELGLRPDERLLVVPGELTDHWQLEFLIESLGPVLREHGRLRLWIAGTGPRQQRLEGLLRDWELHRQVLLPGMFSCLESLLQAADLCLFPGRGCGQSCLLPTCLTSGIPVLCAASAESNQLCGQAQEWLTFNGDSADSLRACLERWLRQPEVVERAVKEVGQRLRRHPSGQMGPGGLAELLRLPSVASAHARRTHLIDQP